MVNVQAGLVENVKRAVINAFRKTITEEYPDDLASIANNISMEYPMKESEYPAVWVQFSFRNLQKAGFDPTFQVSSTINGNQQSVTQYQLWAFDGTVNINIFATTSLMRDKLSDAFIKMYSFASIDTTANTFYQSLDNYPYIFFTIDSDALTAGGQSISIGTVWQEDQIIYEDSYSFNLVGQFASDNQIMLAYNLDSVTTTPEVATSITDEQIELATMFAEDGNGQWF